MYNCIIVINCSKHCGKMNFLAPGNKRDKREKEEEEKEQRVEWGREGKGESNRVWFARLLIGPLHIFQLRTYHRCNARPVG